MTDDGALIRLRAVRKRFGYRDVLRGVDLDLGPGACLVISGSNGAGKSTLLRIVATRWTASSGSVELLGHDVSRSPEAAQREIGSVFHESCLRPELTLEENLRLAAGLHGLRWQDVKAVADGLLERFELARRRHDRVATFSQGMTRRGNLIWSRLHGPRVWILDEPFAGLDTAGCAILEDEVRTFVGDGGTALLVTHQAAHGERVATEQRRIVAGRFGDDSTPDAGARDEGASAEEKGQQP